MAHRLLIQRRGRRPQVFRLLQSEVVIGRGKGTDLLLPDISVSRQHARVVRVDDTGHKIVDMRSQNGTKVNGQKVDEVMLKEGDELQIGKFLLTYEFKPVRSVEDSEKMTDTYTLDGERTGFLKKVSAIDENAHSTTILSQEQLDHVRRLARLKENAKFVLAGTGDTWKIGKNGLIFGKGGIEIDGGGLGGTATVTWNGKAHQITKMGGLFFNVMVNGAKIETQTTLSPNDRVVVGKSQFTYQV
jgi:pSer/pThr/pTyr-binding forkhead associated (FHA) protein